MSIGRKCWEIFADACDYEGYDVTAACIRDALDRNGRKRTYSNSDSVARKIKCSVEYSMMLIKIRRYFNEHKVSEIGKSYSLVFESSDDLDLYGALHGVSCFVKAKKVNSYTLQLDITITDRYDFKYNQVEVFAKKKGIKNKLGDLANNLAYFSQNMDLLKPYDIVINMTDSIEF